LRQPTPGTLGSMRVVLVALGMVLLCALGAGSKDRRGRKAPDIEILASHLQRRNGEITVDGRVRNSGGKPVRGLVVAFDFFSADGEVVSSERTEATEDVLQPGQEAAYHAITGDPVRAVRYNIRVFNGDQRQLRVGNSGPFAIE